MLQATQALFQWSKEHWNSPLLSDDDEENDDDEDNDDDDDDDDDGRQRREKDKRKEDEQRMHACKSNDMMLLMQADRKGYELKQRNMRMQRRVCKKEMMRHNRKHTTNATKVSQDVSNQDNHYQHNIW